MIGQLCTYVARFGLPNVSGTRPAGKLTTATRFFVHNAMAAAGLKSESMSDSRRTELMHKPSRHSLVLCPRSWIPTYHPFMCTLDKLATSLGW